MLATRWRCSMLKEAPESTSAGRGLRISTSVNGNRAVTTSQRSKAIVGLRVLRTVPLGQQGRRRFEVRIVSRRTPGQLDADLLAATLLERLPMVAELVVRPESVGRAAVCSVAHLAKTDRVMVDESVIGASDGSARI